LGWSGKLGVAVTEYPVPANASRRGAIDALDERLDHVRGPLGAPVILEYGDYECPYARAAFRAIERVEKQFTGGVRFAFRHFPLTRIHPHAARAAAAAEAAALQGEFWEMSELLFHHQVALEDEDLWRYARELNLDLARFHRDRTGEPVRRRVLRDIRGALASGEVTGTPTLFIDGVLYRGRYDAATLVEVLSATSPLSGHAVEADADRER
jgi:protein-disulfide isomerase